MKRLVLSVTLVSSFSVAALGQANRDRHPSEFPTPSDRSQIWGLETNTLDAAWPDNNQPARNGNDSRDARTVSLKELQHKIPKAAMKEYDKGIQAFQEGKLWLAKERFQKAINIDPEFADAHNGLGVAIGNVGETNQAIAEFQKTIELSPRSIPALANLSVALYFQKRYHEVCQVARRTLNVDPTLTLVRYAFALSAIADYGDTSEALANLNRVAREFPEAHIAASKLLIKIGRPDDAARHLEAYLECMANDDPMKARVQARLAQLRP